MFSGLSSSLLRKLPSNTQPFQKQQQSRGQRQRMIPMSSELVLPVSAEVPSVAQQVPPPVRWEESLMARIARATTTAKARNEQASAGTAPAAGFRMDGPSTNIARTLAQRRKGKAMEVGIPTSKSPKRPLYRTPAICHVPAGPFEEGKLALKKFRFNGPQQAPGPTLAQRRKGTTMSVWVPPKKMPPLPDALWPTGTATSDKETFLGESASSTATSDEEAVTGQSESMTPTPYRLQRSGHPEPRAARVVAPVTKHIAIEAAATPELRPRSYVVIPTPFPRRQRSSVELSPPTRAGSLDYTSRSGVPTPAARTLVPKSSAWLRASNWSATSSSFDSPTDASEE